MNAARLSRSFLASGIIFAAVLVVICFLFPSTRGIHRAFIVQNACREIYFEMSERIQDPPCGRGMTPFEAWGEVTNLMVRRVYPVEDVVAFNVASERSVWLGKWDQKGSNAIVLAYPHPVPHPRCDPRSQEDTYVAMTMAGDIICTNAPFCVTGTPITQ